MSGPPGFYVGYEVTKKELSKRLGKDQLPTWALLTSGGMGGMAYVRPFPVLIFIMLEGFTRV